MNMEKESRLHNIVVISAVMHFLLLSLMAIPHMTKEREEKSYHVNLVSLPEMRELKNKPEPVVTKKAVSPRKRLVPAKSVKKKETIMPRSKSAGQILRVEEREVKPAQKTAPSKQVRAGKTPSGQNALPPASFWKAENEGSNAEKDAEIRRAQQPPAKKKADDADIKSRYSKSLFASTEKSEHQPNMASIRQGTAEATSDKIIRRSSGTAYKAGENYQKKKYIISGDSSAKQDNTDAVIKRYSNPMFESDTQSKRNSYMIAVNMRTVQAKTDSVERSYSGPMFESNGNFQKERIVPRGSRAGHKADVPELLKAGLARQTFADFDVDHGPGSGAEGGAVKAIEMTGHSPVYNPRKTTYDLEDQFGIKKSRDDDPDVSSESYGSVISEVPIAGLSLDDLMACTNARDERALKKNILNIIGSKHKCSSPESGTFVFLGTDRFTSFDMLVFPAPQRHPENRCEELKNAYFCLSSIKE
jgi:hypothetical protein